MNKKIKVIELLNKIANGEDVPSNIKVEDKEYCLDGSTYYTVGEDDEDLFCLESYTSTLDFLKSEVEILEDNTEDKGYELLKTIKNENNFEGFEEFGEKMGKIYFDMLKGFKKAFENEFRKEKESEDKQ